jgi:Family of unknown function (DUF6159)
MSFSSRRKRSRPPRFEPSRELVNAAYRLLFADKWIIGLLLVGGLAMAAAIALVMVPAELLDAYTFRGGPAGLWSSVIATACLVWIVTPVMVLVSGTVVAAATIRADGGIPTARAALAVVWSRRRPLAAWALVAAIFGTLAALLDRLGIAGVLARFAVVLGWAVATMFAVPLVMSQGTMPAATVRTSARLVGANFGTVARSQIRLASPWTVAAIGAVLEAMIGFIVLVGSVGHLSGQLVGAALTGMGALGFIFFVVTSAGLGAYLDTILFRYATGQPLVGIDPSYLPPVASAN